MNGHAGGPSLRAMLGPAGARTNARARCVEEVCLVVLREEVPNQPPELVGHDVYGQDAVLRAAVARGGAAWDEDDLHALGRMAGTAEAIGWGEQANAHPPVLRTHDRFGRRVDEVEFHPAWHAVLGAAVESGLHAAPWADGRPGAHVARAAGQLVWSQVEAGMGCPTSMTYAAVPVLRHAPALAEVWEPRLTARAYDPLLRPVADKRGALCGMGMTEKQGGSDVRATTTVARPAGDGAYALTGHKWFCSVPMSDAFLVLAQAPAGLSCLLMPRVLPDGTRNRIAIQRLKDKLGNRSNASSEIELDEAIAWLVGQEGRGVRTIVEMVNLTRLDCVLGTAAIMRQAVTQAVHHARYRSAFGALLVDAPLMQSVLADLALESEAASTLGMRLAGAVDASERGDEREGLVRRLGTAVAKYWVCKRGPAVAAEALECLGGNGYVEESVMPRLYREAPLNSVWEGSGNVVALDVLRAVTRTPETAEALLDELDLAAGADARLDRAVRLVREDLAAVRGDGEAIAARAGRRLVERMAVAWQASLLVRHAPVEVADAFCAARVAGDAGLAFGTLPVGSAVRVIVERHAVAPPGAA
jgi:putative acyl-CoA dehydrogenase